MNEMVKTNKLFKKAVQGINITNVQKWNSRHLPNTKKTVTKSEEVVKFIDSKNRNNKDNNKSHKKDSSNNKKNLNNKNSVTEKQFFDLDISMEIEDNDCIGFKSLPEILLTSEDSNTCDTDKT